MKRTIKIKLLLYAFILPLICLSSCEDSSDGNGGENWRTKLCDDSSEPYVVTESERQEGTFYVGPNGCNMNDGSEEAPWRSIAFACNHVKEGSTIRLLAGTIFEDSICKVPKNVNIIGKGRSITIVKSRNFYHGVVGDWDVAKDKYLFQFADDCDGVEISNFTLDGNDHQAHGGILINKNKNLTIKNMVVRNFNFNGMWVTNSENLEIDNIYMDETSMPSSASCSGMLMIGNTTNAEIKNSKFTNSTKDYGGYGIKTWNYQWVTSHPSDVDNTTVMLENVQFLNNEFNLYPYGGWRDGTSANICVELYNSSLSRCLIENNTFVGNLSMVGVNIKTDYAVKVLNNQFLMPTTNEGYQYAIENDFNKVEIAYNFIERGRYPVASWHAGIVDELNVHHNVFNRTLQPDGILLFSGAAKNLKFENNTVLYDEQVFDFIGTAKDGNCVFSIKIPQNTDLISVKNNIFYCYDGDKKNNVPLIQIPSGTSLNMTNIKIDNNAFYNWTVDGTNGLDVPMGNAMFNLAGKTYKEKFGLKSESVCAGKNLGAIN